MSTETTDRTQQYYKYLDNLRLSGVTNMFGAGPFLEKTFGLTPPYAHEVLINWMLQFKG